MVRGARLTDRPPKDRSTIDPSGTPCKEVSHHKSKLACWTPPHPSSLCHSHLPVNNFQLIYIYKMFRSAALLAFIGKSFGCSLPLLTKKEDTSSINCRNLRLRHIGHESAVCNSIGFIYAAYFSHGLRLFLRPTHHCRHRLRLHWHASQRQHPPIDVGASDVFHHRYQGQRDPRLSWQPNR